MNKKTYVSLLSVGVILLMALTPLATSEQIFSPVLPQGLDESFSIEYADISAGIDTAALASIMIYGGTSTYPSHINPDDSWFVNANNFVIYTAKQEGYEAYLQRSPVQTADNVSLIISYPASFGEATTIGYALDAKNAVEAEYGITMYMVLANTLGSTHSFIFVGGSASTSSAVITDVTDFSSGGFDDAISATTVEGAPVFAAGYGVMTLGSYRVAFHGALWVNTNGVPVTGTSRSISTADIYGGDLNPATGFGLSRVRINVPYPISPTNISPATSNPLPQVTGQAIWDLRHPVAAYSLGDAASDYRMDFTIGMATQFPMIENKMSVNQTALNDGTFKVDFDLTNVGQADAQNIKLSFPVGADFKKLVNMNMSLYRMKDYLYLDEADMNHYNISLSFDAGDLPTQYLPSELNYEFLTLEGWYKYNDNDTKVNWDAGSTTMNILTQTVNVNILTQSYPVTVYVNVNGPQGFPTAVSDALSTIIVPALAGVSTADPSNYLGNVKNTMINTLPDVLDFAYNETLMNYYEKKSIFDFVNGNFSVVDRIVGEDTATMHTETFLEANVSTLAASASTHLSFEIDNVPTDTDTFQQIYYIFNHTTINSVELPYVDIQSKVRDYNDLMQYIFANYGFNGHPLSHLIWEGSTANLLGLDTANQQVYASMGMLFTWEDTNGFEFYGLSNGQNPQIADDEAVIATTVRFRDNAQVFTVGDEVTIDVTVQNTGDIAATDVTVNLVHALLGRNWQFNRMEVFNTTTIDSIAANETVTYSLTVTANTFIGYHPVFAIVDFITDAGQGPEPVHDYANNGITTWIYGGEARHLTTSTLIGALLLPATNAARPAVPEPRIEFSTSISANSETLVYEITATNVGNAPTTILLLQSYPTSSLSLTDSVATKGVVSDYTNAAASTGLVTVRNVALNVSESVTLTLTFDRLDANGLFLPPAAAVYQIAGESSLGDRGNTGTSPPAEGSGSGGLALAADASAQEESQASATESGEYTAYSGGAAVGAAGNAGGGTNSQKIAAAFLGPEFGTIVAVMAIPLVFGSFLRRKLR